VASLRDGRRNEQAYWMTASGRRSKAFVVAGSLEDAIQGDTVTHVEVKGVLPSQWVTTDIFIKNTDNMRETVDFYASLVRHCGRRMVTGVGLAGWVENTS